MPTRAPRWCLHPGCKATVSRQGYCPAHPPTTVHLVIGPPCSGKTTYVAQHAKPGDLIVDWDALMLALSGQPGRRDHPQLHGYAADARNAILARLTQRRAGPEPTNAWVIATNPIAIGDVRPQVHVMDTTVDECVRRLYADPDGRTVAEVERVIRSWRP